MKFIPNLCQANELLYFKYKNPGLLTQYQIWTYYSAGPAPNRFRHDVPYENYTGHRMKPGS